MGIRYILSNGTAYPNDKYSLVYTNGNVKVYQNEEAKSFGTGRTSRTNDFVSFPFAFLTTIFSIRG